MTRELSDPARAMLERALAEERPLLPGLERRARVKRSLLQGAAMAASGQAAAHVAGQAAVGKAAVGAASLLPLAKGIAVGLLLSGGLLASAPLFTNGAPASPAARDGAAPAPSVVGSSRVQALPAPTSVATNESSPSVEAPEDVAPPPRLPSAAPTPSAVTPGLAAELQLLTAAQTALRDGRGADALALLERYDRAFPVGQLLGERLAAEVFAACQQGNRARAARAAQRFLQNDSSSVLAGRVRRSCAFASGGSEP